MTDGNPVRLAVLVSGNGTNLQAVIDRIASGGINATIACVISNRRDAFALKRAEKHNIPAIIHESGAYADRREYDAALVDLLRDHGAQLVVLAGFMRILTDVMVTAFPHAIMNIHPALLPAFPGLHAQKQALDYGVRFSGCTVHFVDGGTDTGPIILQAVVPVPEDDTEEKLAARIQHEEHRIYPEAIRLFCAGKIRVEGRRVRLSP
ncbi:phosphoribosylglycinamide formyltransferase [Oryzomonas sagensis]|uniref:Phosphoribosylglycinamide formyltransferase n=1 Tax=Oryzomonas sagensis TaxID=2603857 RepID=A0ABQ6TNE7_9BACT|nr:phosphoribosylglycinamide formyltransferase [Oryzomonas sagensis]KAB0669618.1 phosphoribosylglycinamide formyltransferase [Oryzomonas sagensis]